MSKKNYVSIANTLRYYYLRVIASNDEYAIITIKNMIDDFAYYFEIDNPRFDRNKFYEACGYSTIQAV